ncbi:PREDICTED: transient receptor potential cation channel subfamily M member 5 [Condylura cristata]|uniref:transient receptor potential cation channel subfamily M member 5 n=1 Tax=Condylura cristata TaxID=143302 RepID=UPI00064370C2|nr:PREDICTED: transient receptor potential cation channel subfamily M member 5 [Condylura cristata]
MAPHITAANVKIKRYGNTDGAEGTYGRKLSQCGENEASPTEEAPDRKPAASRGRPELKLSPDGRADADVSTAWLWRFGPKPPSLKTRNVSSPRPGPGVHVRPWPPGAVSSRCGKRGPTALAYTSAHGWWAASQPGPSALLLPGTLAGGLARCPVTPACSSAWVRGHKGGPGGAWILTSALRVGLARHVGQAVRDHSLASSSSKARVVTIGMASLGHVLHSQLLDFAQEDRPVQYPADGSSQGPRHPLDSSHSHFILVEPGPRGTGDGATELRLRLEQHISEQRASYGACKSHSQEPQDYLDELKLAVAWDRVDIARSEIFNGDVEWKSRHLEEVMMDALVSDKPEFVRLFVDNGADVADFLTLGRLQQLYRSVAPRSLLFGLLRRKHEEGRLALAPQPREPPSGQPAFSLLEVSRLLKDFLHDACRGFYQAVRPGPDALVLQKGPAKRPTGQKGLLDLSQKSETPWRDLFLWAVLQGRHEMATYFWAMGQEGVAAALAACKILKEMSHLETQAQAGSALREAKYEQLALDLFSECYSSSQDRAFALLVRRNRCWGRTTCLHLAAEADAKAFFAHDGVQAFLTKIWWGDMASGTPILRLLGAFFCPALIYTNLITFSEEAPLRTGPEDLQELDSLDTEKSPVASSPCRVKEPGPQERRARGPQAAFLLARWRKFWGAPVTVFLGNVVMYFAFLLLFAHVLLVDFRPPPQGPSGPEVTLYFWVFTLVLEEIRQGFFTDEDSHLAKQLTLYVEDNWNKCDMVAILLFVVGVTCRMLPSAFEAGRTVLALDFMVFALRLIHIFAIHKQLGPKIIIVERMDLQHGGRGAGRGRAAGGVWRQGRALMASAPSYTFQAVQGNADTFWKSQRYHLTVEYHERPALAPPFILLSHLGLALQRALRRGARPRRARLDRDLPQPLDQKVAAWEAVQKEDFLGKLAARRKDSQGELLRKAAHRADFVVKYLGGLREQDRRIRRLESQVNYCTVLLSSVADSLAQGISHQTEAFLPYQTLATWAPGTCRPLLTTVLATGSTPKLPSCPQTPSPRGRQPELPQPRSGWAGGAQR